MCPNCRTTAPIVYRGVLAYCTACGAPRPPFSGRSTTFAGKPGQIGGTVAGVLGTVFLVLGLLLALTITWILQWLVGGYVGFAFGGPVAILTLAIGLPLVLGGRRWRKAGEDESKASQLEAAYAMALHRGGAVTALDLSQSLGISLDQADVVLTELTKKYADYVSVELDEAGKIFYRLAGVPGVPGPGLAKYRVQADGRVRIEDPFDASAAEDPDAAAHPPRRA